MGRELSERYGAFYNTRDPQRVYPVEFVVRAFLGSYPRLTNTPAAYAGERILDLGFGDGRNMPLLADLGMRVFGVEISEEICARTRTRMQRLGVAVELHVGRNAQLPFDDGFFDQVLACHSCYYVDADGRFSDNVREIGRVLRPGGRLVASLPMPTTYVLRGARDLGGGHMEVRNDPYELRNGCILMKFDSQRDIERAFAPRFEDLRIGSCLHDFWGIEEHIWTVVCRRRTDVQPS
jgi:SAM-dependent methyltransferase